MSTKTVLTNVSYVYYTCCPLNGEHPWEIVDVVNKHNYLTFEQCLLKIFPYLKGKIGANKYFTQGSRKKLN